MDSWKSGDSLQPENCKRARYRTAVNLPVIVCIFSKIQKMHTITSYIGKKVSVFYKHDQDYLYNYVSFLIRLCCPDFIINLSYIPADKGPVCFFEIFSVENYSRMKLFANSSTIKLFPTRLAPSINNAVLPWLFFSCEYFFCDFPFHLAPHNI